MPEKQEKLINQKYGFKQAIKSVLSQIKNELNEHLEAINENTNEIESNYEYIQEFDEKLEKIKLRLDNLELFLSKNTGFRQANEEKLNIEPLSVNEKLVFMTLYTADSLISYFDISQKIGLSESLVRSYITNLIEKGVPIIKKYINGSAFIFLEKEFKDLQAKQNLVKIQQKQISTF